MDVQRSGPVPSRLATTRIETVDAVRPSTRSRSARSRRSTGLGRATGRCAAPRRQGRGRQFAVGAVAGASACVVRGGVDSEPSASAGVVDAAIATNLSSNNVVREYERSTGEWKAPHATAHRSTHRTAIPASGSSWRSCSPPSAWTCSIHHRQRRGPLDRPRAQGQHSELQWVIGGYTLAMAVGLISGARLGDIYGRKRMFLIGASASFSRRSGARSRPTRRC